MTADPITWAGLQTSLANWLNRDDLSTTEIPEAIALAERRFQRKIFTPDREAALSLTATSGTVALPADFWGIHSGPYVDASSDVVLEKKTVNELRTLYPDSTTGTPLVYAIDGTNMLLGPIPSSSTAIKGTYYAVIPVLSGSQTTNWLLTAYPDVYMHAALAELNILVRDLEWYQLFEQRTVDAIEEINKAGRRRSANAGDLCASSDVCNVANIQA